MLGYSKLSQGGIAAISYLAGIYAEGRLAGSAEIADARNLSHHLVAKILTMLSRAGLVAGTPGPAGGYKLARPPADITLLDVIRIFGDSDYRVMCPYGPKWCGTGPKCPLHDTLREMHQSTIARLAAETLSQFVVPPENRGD
jgi:Rrf2 family protein